MRARSHCAKSAGQFSGAGGFAGQPPGFATLFLTEIWERFSYYGMRALLALFMVAPVAQGGLGWTLAEAAPVYGTYTMAVYMLSIPGGFLADRFVGARYAVLAGGAIIACGHFALAYGSLPAFYAGLILIALGTGLFKPNISAMVGGLYALEDTRRDAGFSIFYMGINIGGFAAPLVTGFLAQSDVFKGWLAAGGFDPAKSWHWGFGAAGVGMIFGLLVYVLRWDRLLEVGGRPRIEAKSWGQAALILAGTGAAFALVHFLDYPAELIRWLSGGDGGQSGRGFSVDREWLEWLRLAFLLAPALAVAWFATRDDGDSRRMAAILVFAIAAMIFWAIFEQQGLSIALFADRHTRGEMFGWPFPSAWFQALNPLFVILLTPFFVWSWVRLGPRQPSAPIKFTLGLVFLGLSFALMVPAAYLTASGKVSPLWLVGLFLLQTIGELFLSPVGLSTMTKLAPVRLAGFVLGLWFLAAALGNKLAGVLGGQLTSGDPAGLAAFFLQQALFVGVAALILFAITPWVRRLMGGVR